MKGGGAERKILLIKFPKKLKRKKSFRHGGKNKKMSIKNHHLENLQRIRKYIGET